MVIQQKTFIQQYKFWNLVQKYAHGPGKTKGKPVAYSYKVAIASLPHVTGL